MNIQSTDSLASCIDFITDKISEAPPMAEELDPSELDGPRLIAAHQIREQDRAWIIPMRQTEILREFTKGDVGWFTINHQHTLYTVFKLENDFGIETQTLPKLVGVEKSTCNRILHSFADKARTRRGLGLIEIRVDENDGRIRRVFLTEKGRELKTLMANAGTYSDNQYDLRNMLNAHAATQMQSMQKAVADHVHLGAEDITTGAPEVQNATVTVEGVASLGFVGKANATAIKMSVDGGEHTLEGSQVRLKNIKALDRAMKDAEASWPEANGFVMPTTVRYKGNNIRVDSPENLRKVDGSKYEIIQTDGYWMIWDLQRGLSNPPVAIQRNLQPKELAAYMNDLVLQINAGARQFSEIMNQAGRWLNKTQYNYVRNHMVHDFADTRTELMKEVAEKEAIAAKAEEEKRMNQDVAEEKKQLRDESAHRGKTSPVWQLNERQDNFATAIDAEKQRKAALERAKVAEAEKAKAEEEAATLRKQVSEIHEMLSQQRGVVISKDEE